MREQLQSRDYTPYLCVISTMQIARFEFVIFFCISFILYAHDCLVICNIFICLLVVWLLPTI